MCLVLFLFLEKTLLQSTLIPKFGLKYLIFLLLRFVPLGVDGFYQVLPFFIDKKDNIARSNCHQ